MAKLIALVDGSIYSQSICDHAAWIAKRADAVIDIVHVLGRRDVGSEPANLSGSIGFDAGSTLLGELAELDGQKARLAQKRGRAILDSARERVIEAGITDVSTRLRIDEIVSTVLELEKDADLVVVGKRGEAADFDKLHLGSSLERVVRSIRKPVLVASRAFKPIERFLIAFDGGASAQKAVEHIASFHMFADLECKLLSVGAETAALRASLEDAATLLRNAGYRVETEIQPGDPEKVIAEKIKAEDLHLLIMGAYGHSRIRSLIIGSTTTEMVRSCMVPVLLFR